MRFGVFLLAAQFPGPDHTTVLDSSVAAAVAAEEVGFDDVWVAEHHFISYGICPSAITLAGYLLGATRRIGVGTAVSVLSTQHPVGLAEQALLLDQLSGGRFRLGVGRGGPWIDLEVFGTGMDRYQHGFPESLDLLLAALSGVRLASSGAHFRFSGVDIVPRPRTSPHPDVSLAATTTGTVELAAQRGLPLLLGKHASDTEKAALIDHYNQIATRPRGHLAAALAYVADSQHEAITTMRTCLPRWLGPGLARRGKTDTLDAEAAARAVLSGPASGSAKAGDGPVEMLRMLKLAKDSAVKARSQTINQLKAVLVAARPCGRITHGTGHRLPRPTRRPNSPEPRRSVDHNPLRFLAPTSSIARD